MSKISNLNKLTELQYLNLNNNILTSLNVSALTKLQESIKNINAKYPIDIVEIDLLDCYNTLGEIIGLTYKDELIDEMFSRFCLGK